MKFLQALLALLVPLVPAAAENSSCSRIVSLAPSITEVLFELGLGSNVVGVTRYCRFPPEAELIKKVGGYFDLNAEAIFSLKPTKVFALGESEKTTESLKALRLSVVALDHMSVEGIKQSIAIVGRECGVEDRAQRVIADLTSREERIATKIKGGESLKVLVSVGRTRSGSAVSGVYVSGQDGFYTGVLALLGARNVNTRKTIAVPTISSEGILALSPDAIVEIVNVDDPEEPDAPEKFWRQFKGIPAARNNRIVAVKADYGSIPGPRYIQLAELLAEQLFPAR
jgi:iron complex transport system substrate-binding protein